MTNALRVLVVDDHVDVAASMAALVEVLGHGAQTANSGQDALAQASRYHPHLVLLDIGMPGMDGYAVARGLRAMPEGSQAYVVACTGYGTPEDRRKALEAGMDMHLTKPIAAEMLLNVLAIAERRAHGRDGA